MLYSFKLTMCMNEIKTFSDMSYHKMFASKAPFLGKLLAVVVLQDEVVRGRERHELQETGVWAQQIGKGSPRMKVK